MSKDVSGKEQIPLNPRHPDQEQLQSMSGSPRKLEGSRKARNGNVWTLLGSKGQFEAEKLSGWQPSRIQRLRASAAFARVSAETVAPWCKRRLSSEL